MYFVFAGIRKVWKINIAAKVIIILLFLLLALYIYFDIVKPSCNGWNDGIGGLKLENPQGECPIIAPNYCEMTMKDGLLDLTWIGKDCEDRPQTFFKSSLPEKLKDVEFTTLGYPRTEDYEPIYKYDQLQFMNKVRDSVINMDDPNLPDSVKESVEFTVDMSDNTKSVLNFKVKRNNTRVEELKKVRADFMASAKKDPEIDIIDSDVFIFYIDGFSRTNLKRQLPKFYEWLGQFVNNDEKEIDAYQFFRYHTIKENTYIANHALWYGIEGFIKNDSDNVFQFFQDRGYMMGHIRDGCEQDSVIMSKGDPVQTTPVFRWDHYAVGYT